MNKCIICGISTNNLRFCSYKCYGIYQRKPIEIKCLTCNKIIISKPSKPRKFCSKRCEKLSGITGFKKGHQTNIGKKRPPRSKKWCENISKSLKKDRRWLAQGYWHRYRIGHPKANVSGSVKECVLVMEKKIGRQLHRNEIVHHIDLDTTNDNPDNLMLFPNIKEHIKFHKNIK